MPPKERQTPADEIIGKVEKMLGSWESRDEQIIQELIEVLKAQNQELKTLRQNQKFLLEKLLLLARIGRSNRYAYGLHYEDFDIVLKYLRAELEKFKVEENDGEKG